MFFPPEFSMCASTKGLWGVVLFSSPAKLLVVTPVRGCELYPVGNTLSPSESGCLTPSKCLQAQD